jgi:hypothetical protein
MATYIVQGRVITELDPPLTTTVNIPVLLKSVTVNVHSGQASVFLGPLSGDTVILKAGESINISTLASNDQVEVATVQALGVGASVLVMWGHF